MQRLLIIVLPVLGAMACSDPAGGGARDFDAVSLDRGEAIDGHLDEATLPDQGRDVVQIGDLELPSADAEEQDSGLIDQGPFDSGRLDSVQLDSGPLDHGTVDPSFCRSFADCADGAVCDFSLGRCEPRDSWKTGKPALYAFHPPAAGAGDLLVIDGSVFFTNLFSSMFGVTADVGGKPVAGGAGNIGVDENRMIGRIPAGASGAVRVVFGDGGGVKTFSVPLGVLPAGVVACDDSTPGRDVAGDSPIGAGPYAAGYLDIDLHYTRVFYPAECGSVRRPGVAGTWPLLVVLAGNGALHLNHQQTAQLLATWGFITVMPMTEQTNEWSVDASRQIRDVVDLFRGKADLADVHPALAGLGTTSTLAFMGHSRGCGRTLEYLEDFKTTREHLVATVFLGPHDRNVVVPGAFLVFGAGKDGQSFKSFTDNAYSRQGSPKWKVWIPDGNHGDFCDHKVYYSMDGQPGISRHAQLVTVQTFVVPFLQRAFGRDEPFAAWLDSPPPSMTYTVESTP